MEDAERISDKGKGKAISKQKPADFIKIGSQAAEQQRLQNNLKVDQRSMSRSQDLKIKQDKHSMPKHRDANLQVTQAIWGGGDHVVPNSKKQSHTNRQYGLPIQRSYSTSRLSERPFNTGRRKEIPVLAGGGDPDDSSSKQNASVREQLTEFNTALGNSMKLYGGDITYAYSQTKDAFPSNYVSTVENYTALRKSGYTHEASISLLETK